MRGTKVIFDVFQWQDNDNFYIQQANEVQLDFVVAVAHMQTYSNSIRTSGCCNIITALHLPHLWRNLEVCLDIDTFGLWTWLFVPIVWFRHAQMIPAWYKQCYRWLLYLSPNTRTTLLRLRSVARWQKKIPQIKLGPLFSTHHVWMNMLLGRENSRWTVDKLAERTENVAMCNSACMHLKRKQSLFFVELKRVANAGPWFI